MLIFRVTSWYSSSEKIDVLYLGPFGIQRERLGKNWGILDLYEYTKNISLAYSSIYLYNRNVTRIGESREPRPSIRKALILPHLNRSTNVIIPIFPLSMRFS